MYQRALQGYEKAWGPEHTSTLNTVNNLGNLYKNLGRLDEAEKMYCTSGRCKATRNVLAMNISNVAVFVKLLLQ
jgi:hypothetical protein